MTLRLFAEKGRLADEVMAFHKLEGKAVPKATFVDEARTVGVR